MTSRRLIEHVSTDGMGLDRHSFMWVELKRFAIDITADTAALLVGLVEQKAFRGALIDYDTAGGDDFEVHGPYLASDLVPARYVAMDESSARSILCTWADGDGTFDPADPDDEPDHHPQSTETHARLEANVFSLFERGLILHLDTDQLEVVDWAYVGRGCGFHEFVVIDRDRGYLDLIVAADD